MNFGILCNGNSFQQWQIDTISHLMEGGHTCSLLIVNATPFERPGIREKIIEYPYSKLLYRVWFRFLMKPGAKNMANLTDHYTDIPEIACLTTRKGYADYFTDADVDSIRSYHLDFMLRFGFGIIKGDILDVAKYGIWSYHHDDDRKYRGVPTGFWEILFDDPVNAAILQRLTSQLDSGVILRKAYFATISHSWQANLDNLLKSSTEWPLQVCRDIENGNTAFLSVWNTPGTAIYKLPGNARMLRFLLKVFVNKVRFHFRDLFLTEKWNIGIIRQPVEHFLVPGETNLPEPEWLNISKRKKVYHADPFGFEKDGNYHILCEEYDYSNNKGILTSVLADSRTLEIRKKNLALEKEHHLAFPYLFEHGGVYYCLPENSEGGQVDLYRYNEASGKLIFECTLIENLKAVDTSLHYYNGLWWLMFTDKVSTNERLHIWYSSTLNGPYQPHANNPVKVDIRSSRPAGKPFTAGGKLFRPAQDCTIRSGRRICINEILELTPTTFVEKEYAVLNPKPGSGFSKGMHTFCVAGNSIIVDGKRECFIWQAFADKLLIKVSKILRRNS